MRGQTIAQACVAVLFSIGLAACGGGGPQFSIGNPGSSGSSSSSGASSSSGSSGSSSGTTTQVAAHVILASSSSTLAANAGAAGSSVTLTATVTDSNNVSIPGYPVSFTANGGVLTPAASVTDVNGNITATLLAGSSSPGATITAFATASPLAAVSTAVTVNSTTPVYVLGSLSTTGVFTAGTIAIGQTPLAAGGSSGLQVAIVDTANGNTPFTGAGTVVFTSPCQSQSLAQIGSPISGTTGIFSSTYQAQGCSGNDKIAANAVISGSTLSATGTINVLAASLGSVQFVSATPTSIGLKGTGLTESSTIIFKVVDSNGNAVQNQQVDFTLTTTAGGLTVSPQNAKSDANGNVQTTVQSGTVHTSVRVTAVIDGTSLTTQSSQLTVSTGLPTQNGFSLAAADLNLVGDNFDGNTTTVTARLADRYANPVPDGTAVAFTTECGSIQPSCSTVGGACSVTFTTQNPRTSSLAFPSTATIANPTYDDNSCSTSSINGDLGCDDHRCTVTAYAIGEESFNDCNGTGLYVSKDNTSNNPSQCPSGDFFVSLPEVFFDYNESGIFDGRFESYVDFNHNGKYDAASGKFIGLLCNDPDCDPNQTSLNVSQDLVIVMSNSNLQVVLNTAPPPAFNPHSYVGPLSSVSGVTMSIGGTKAIFITVGDTAWQRPATGTTVAVSMSNGGTVLAPASTTVLNSSTFGYYTVGFTLQAPTTSKSNVDTITVTTTSPPFGSGSVVTSFSFPVTYVAPVVTLSSSALSFGNTTVGSISPAQTVTITNTGTIPLNIGTLSITGTSGSDYLISNNTCTAAVAVNSSCAISVKFAPTVAGALSASLIINSNAPSSPDQITLSGTGT